MSTAVVVPYQTGPARPEALHFVWNRLADDGWPVVLGTLEHRTIDDPRWCKAEAVAQAVAMVALHGHRDDVLVIQDADVLVDLASLRIAVDAVETGRVAWAIPHTLVVRLSEDATAHLYADDPLDPPTLTRQPYVGMPGGGCVVIRRETYEDCPLDRRFCGWGDEDQAWGWALGTLYGAAWRADADLIHLWHPHAAPHQLRSPSLDSSRLRRAYRAYRSDPTKMRELVDAGR
jgi:hypothetical protein